MYSFLKYTNLSSFQYSFYQKWGLLQAFAMKNKSKISSNENDWLYVKTNRKSKSNFDYSPTFNFSFSGK